MPKVTAKSAEALKEKQLKQLEELKICFGNIILFKKFRDDLITKLAKEAARNETSVGELKRKIDRITPKLGIMYMAWLWKNREQILAERAERRRAFLRRHELERRV